MEFVELDAHMKTLTSHQRKIVEAIYEAGDAWLTRSKLAHALDKRRLTPYDIDCLKRLTEIELIATSTQPTTAPGSDFAYIYNMPDEVATTLQEWAEKNDKQASDTKRKPINLSDD